MSISLDDLRTTRADKPARWLLIGPPKIGKTTFASEFPSPVFIQAEDGTPGGLELTSWQVDNYADVLGAIEALFGEHNFRTLVLDSTSAVEPMIWREVCERNKWPSIEAPGYGKGYVEADLLWQELMRAITALRRERGMAIVLIAHSEIKRIEDPIVGPLDRFVPQLHKRAVDIIAKEVDIIAFVTYRISVAETKGKFNAVHRKGVGSGERVIYFADRPGFMAGNRYGMPDELDYKPGAGFAAIAEYLPGMGEDAAAEQQQEPATRRARQREAA